MKQSKPFLNEKQSVMTVQGPISYSELGITDGHNHIWIEEIPGVGNSSLVLNQFSSIAAELIDFFMKGGRSLLDCQPFGCGRNGNQLLALSKASGVHVIASTGFHRKIYYPPLHPFWEMDSVQVAELMIREINEGLIETLNIHPVKAGFIKIALEADWKNCPMAALEGAAEAARETQFPIEIHTEKGFLAEEILKFFTEKNIDVNQLILCHMDKRPDIELHKELAMEGISLEYDTFFRLKYKPKKNLWLLIDKMVEAGYAKNLILATDMAEASSYSFIANGPGLASLPDGIQKKMVERGIPGSAIKQMIGENIAQCLARIH